VTITQDADRVPQYAVFEFVLEADANGLHPIFETAFTTVFTRPDGSTVSAEGFYDGHRRYKTRAYADALGEWQWQTSASLPDLHNRAGRFTVLPSELKGQLIHHPNDPHQFAYENGDWFLHIGDTGYRYVADTEPEWRAYFDQAAAAGFTKIRSWFNRGRYDVQALFNPERTSLNLPYWQEIDRRMCYALKTDPQIIFKLIPYGEDTDELLRYATDPLTQWIARYAQARFSAFPNVYWCVSNDREVLPDGEALSGRQVHESTIAWIATDMAAREPWGTLLTNHQCRFKGYSFCQADWSDLVTLEDLDQVHGEVILAYRAIANVPVVHEEDRYEHYRPPAHPRYFFRRLMWASLLSGGHATYGGLSTFEAYDGKTRGMQGYYDAARAGKLVGAQDFRAIHTFFNDTGLTLVGFVPDDRYVGNRPTHRKCTRAAGTAIIYLANPNGDVAETATVADTIPDVTIDLACDSVARWFDPQTGLWHGAVTLAAGMQTVIAPAAGDWVLLLRPTSTPSHNQA